MAVAVSVFLCMLPLVAELCASGLVDLFGDCMSAGFDGLQK